MIKPWCPTQPGGGATPLTKPNMAVMGESRLDQVDLSSHLPGKEYRARLKRAQRRLLQLRLVFAGLIGTEDLGPPVCLVFEGWDSAGKGGAIKRLVAGLDPRHVRVVQYAAPSDY
jgi:polyphosphate kinase 2 (PPK2 family)